MRCFTGSGVSGGPNGSIFFPLGGTAVLHGFIRHEPFDAVRGGRVRIGAAVFSLNNFTNPASPAMTKAFLVNSAGVI